jgi:hypothetical protein
MSIRRELSKRRQAARAARATEQGVAGHKAAMQALGRAAGWKRVTAGEIPGTVSGHTFVPSNDNSKEIYDISRKYTQFSVNANDPAKKEIAYPGGRTVKEK